MGGAATHTIVLNATGADAGRAERMLQDLLASLPELLAVALIEVESGRAVAQYATAREQNLNKAASCLATMIKQIRSVIGAMDLGDERVEDVLVTLGSQWHLVRLLPGGERLLYLVVDSRDTNLALARAVMEACVK